MLKQRQMLCKEWELLSGWALDIKKRATRSDFKIILSTNPFLFFYTNDAWRYCQDNIWKDKLREKLKEEAMLISERIFLLKSRPPVKPIVLTFKVQANHAYPLAWRALPDLRMVPLNYGTAAVVVRINIMCHNPCFQVPGSAQGRIRAARWRCGVIFGQNKPDTFYQNITAGGGPMRRNGERL